MEDVEEVLDVREDGDGHGDRVCRAIVMSTGGLVARETADEIGKWKKELGEWTFDKMMGRISLNG